MAAHTPTPLSPSDDELNHLLRGVVGGEAPREKFVASLAEQLETELQLALRAESDRQLAKVSRSASGVPNSRVNRGTWNRTGRSLLALSIAGFVVLAASIWSSQRSYSWATMLQAMEGRPWVESKTEKQTGEEVRGWFSQPNRVIVVRTGNDVVWDDLGEAVQSRYESASGLMRRKRLHADPARSVEKLLLSFLLSHAGRTAFQGDDGSKVTDDITVLSQSWRSVGAGENRRIELDVYLGRDEGHASMIHLVLQLDPETHLPRQCEIVGDGAEVAGIVRFEYPESGPAEVFDVGVPRGVLVVDSTLPDGPVRSARVDQTPAPEDGVLDLEVEDSTLLADPPPDSSEISASADPAEPEQIPAPALVVASSKEMSRQVDDLMAACWDRKKIGPAATCGEEEFFRRVYLDLTGRIPTVSEFREFQADIEPDRRDRLVEQLLARRDHATHLGAVWRKFLLPDSVNLNTYGGSASFEEWLAERFRNNAPYDEIVRDLLLAEGRVSESGPILFYTALKLEPEELAAQTARAFLGMRLECAQCHDHFFDKRWKQTDFWSFAAFFAQISRPVGKMDMVSPVLRVADTNHGEVTLPDSEDVIAPRYPLGETLEDDPEAPSRREQLAVWMTAADNPHFARATVNRVWAHLFGRGLVEPVDDMRIDNPSLCPEVLDELAGYFAATGFDLRDLFRVIVSTDTYQRTSGSSVDDPSRTAYFAQMNIKTFTAEQLYDSISVATRLEPLESIDGSLMRFQNVSRQSFLEQFRAPPGQVTDYQAGIPQALTLMNGRLIQSATDLSSSGVLRSLQAPFFSDEQRVETLFMATLSRQPDDAERQSMLNYVLSDDGERNQRLGDILWALLNSAEFTLNH